MHKTIFSQQVLSVFRLVGNNFKNHLLFKYHVVKMQDIMRISKSNFKPQVSMNKQVGAYITSVKNFFLTV